MNSYAKAVLGAAMLMGATFAMTAPASASVGIEFGFGGPDYAFGDPCDYYDYYDEPPPWGLPPDYCDYPVYFEPVFFDGTWYRGPIYYRWTHGRRLFWLHGGWHEDAWRGPRPPRIDWQTRGGPNHGFRPGVNFRSGYRGGVGSRPWNGPGYHGGRDGDNRPSTGGHDRDRPGGGSHPWQGPGSGTHFGGGSPWTGDGDRGGGGRFGGGDGGSHFGGGNRGDGGSHFGGGGHGSHGPH